MKRIFAAGVAGALVAAYAYFVEPGWIEWTEQEIHLPALPAALDGFRIGHLTDLHVGPSGGNQELAGFLARSNKLQPDLFVVTGDLVNGMGDESAELAKLLSVLQSQHGTIAILGGHDYGDSPKKIARALAEAGITLLRNEAIAVGAPDAQIWVAGMDDNSGSGRPDLDRTLSGVPPEAPLVFLMHSPDSIYQVAAKGVPFALAGHTHGGQICLPFYGAIRTMSQFGRRFVSGRHRVGNTMLYVSRGLASHRHIRFLCRPEVVVWTLRCDPSNR